MTWLNSFRPPFFCLLEDKTPLNPPVYAQEVEQLHRPDTTQTWYTCKNTAIPVDQVAIVSPSVGEKLKLEKQVIPIQLPAAGEVLVKVAWTGICGSVSRPLFNCLLAVFGLTE